MLQLPGACELEGHVGRSAELRIIGRVADQCADARIFEVEVHTQLNRICGRPNIDPAIGYATIEQHTVIVPHG